MAYRLEHEEGSHVGTLGSILKRWSSSQPDVILISNEGHKIHTQSLILRFYSGWLENILDDVTDDVGITLSASSKSIVNLLKVLTSGKVFTKVKDDLLDVSLTAEMLGISFENWQIGAKRRNQNESLSKSVVQVAKTNSKSKC